MKREIQGSKPSFVIVGAGPAGLILGILLSRKKYSTVILEREPSAHRPVCGEYLSPQGVAYLEKLGLHSITENFRRVRGMLMSSPGGKSVLARFPEGHFGLAINRQVLQQRLASLYVEEGGLLFYGENLTSITETPLGLEITTNNHKYQCDALVGADGRLSLVAKLSGMERDANNRRVALHCYLEPKIPLPHYGQMHILPDGSYAGINPISQREVNFSIVTDATLIKEFGSAKNLINHHIAGHPKLGHLFRLVGDEKIKTTHPITCAREKLAKGRITLIGDASGFIDPLTGEGITTAIKTAALLAEKVFAEPSLESAFSAYAKARKTEYRQKETLNHLLQIVIRRPLLCESIAAALRASPLIRSLFIGVIGNIYTSSQAVKLALKNLFFSGRNNHGQDSISPNRISPSPAYTKRSDSVAPDDLAGPHGRARATRENFRG